MEYFVVLKCRSAVGSTMATARFLLFWWRSPLLICTKIVGGKPAAFVLRFSVFLEVFVVSEIFDSTIDGLRNVCLIIIIIKKKKIHIMKKFCDVIFDTCFNFESYSIRSYRFKWITFILINIWWFLFYFSDDLIFGHCFSQMVL